MKVKSVCLQNFRNIEYMEYVPCDGANIIYGDNAQGKTNLLESIWLFSGQKSFRGSKESEFIKFSSDFFKADLDFFAANRAQSAQITVGVKKKKILLNGIEQDRLSSFSGEFCSVVFSPDDLFLIKKGPEKRRRLIDDCLSQVYPKYIKALETYNKSLRQRNSLLKSGGRNLFDTLDIWDKYILEYGSYITWMRVRYIKKLEKYAGEIYNGITLEKEKLSINYIPSFGEFDNSFEREDFYAAHKKSMEKSRSNDLKTFTTTIGPHRDDIEFTINGLNAKSFGSQGQQRSAILALKLAECGILEERNGEPPVVLLDDVMSELDESRQNYLLNQLYNKQTFITCCDASVFKNFEKGSVTHIKNGKIVI